ncbi:MAG: c-type cytochrome [Acidobacteria bacterium]|nr:c-type cytochrome [Acidobacteriota bacterium]
MPRWFAALLFAQVLRAQGLTPAQAEARMKPLDGFKVQLAASEPEIRQPILVKFDDRGRLWVIQYLQYPNPAGLRRVSVDRYSRTTYDRVPDPPPRGPRGADRITIIEDTDGDGRGDKFKDFVSGLNLATGLAIGHGGVFVLQVPYLLFYPDRNRDDVPDSGPEVLLSGFGMEDAQSLANHLTWGPDGWLYGLNGSTATCRIKGIEFQQGVWRYHPITREFELFAEGGGNIYGLAFDAVGNLFYSSNGSSLFWHAVQGAYYQKSFGKHGPLHNPYAYGYFPHVKHNGVPGGHVVLGGLIYSGTSFPESFRETFLGGNFLGRSAAWWSIAPRGSTVEAKFGGLLFDAQDTWFCPTDLAQAPDGSVYVCDFHDERTAHPDPDAPWDRSSGRVYRLTYGGGTKPAAPFRDDLAARSSLELVNSLTSRNRWFADQARVILAARRDPSVLPPLRSMALSAAGGLQGLWGLHVSGGLDDTTALQTLSHPNEHARAWTARLLGDRKRVAPAVAARLAQLAASDPSVAVRAQLAATARRLRAKDALPILEGLWRQDRDLDDPHIPMLIWWALETHAVPSRDAVLTSFAKPIESRLRGHTQSFLVRRYAAEGTPQGYSSAERLLTPATLGALEQGLAERSGYEPPPDAGVFGRFAEKNTWGDARRRQFAPVTGPLRAAIEKLWRGNSFDPLHARLALRAGIPGTAEAILTKPSAPLLNALAEAGTSADAARLSALMLSPDDAIAQAALNAGARFPAPGVTATLLKLAPRSSRALDHLVSRPDSARQLLASYAHRQLLNQEQVRRIALLKDAGLDAEVRRYWGNMRAGTPEEKLATVRRLNNDLRLKLGEADRGQKLFFRHCGSCHKLRGAGGALGMDLTAANRKDRYYMLTHIVDPSVFIRKEYMSVELRTRDGRVVTGLVAEEDAGAITIVDSAYRKTRIAKSDLASSIESAVSIMPEGLLDNLNATEVQDLFAYLERDSPP